MANMPDGRRTPVTRAAWLSGFAAAIVVTGILFLWVLPSLLARHPSKGLTAAEQLAAVNNVRATLVTFLIAVGAAGTLFFSARTFLLSRETQVTDRYTKAVTQIGDNNLEVRIGGIYALERIGWDSAADRPTVVYVLGALIRHLSKDPRHTPDEEPSEDVYTALRVIGRLAPATNVRVDLRNADLHMADLSMLRDADVYIEGADLTGAKVPENWKPALSVGHLAPPNSPTETK
jgi:hypothetical protein